MFGYLVVCEIGCFCVGSLALFVCVLCAWLVVFARVRLIVCLMVFLCVLFACTVV